MARIKLSFASSKHDGIEPLMDGAIQPEGAELVPIYSSPGETFFRQLKFQEFQICEFSISSYLIAREHGMDLIAIPVFPSRAFFQTWQVYNTDSGITRPGDVSGKRIGIPEYQQTAALWARGIMEHDFGVSQFSVDWYMERTEALSHGGVTGFKPPEGIRFHRVPADESLASMLLEQKLDVVLAMGEFGGRQAGHNALDRSGRIVPQAADWTKVKPLFPDAIGEGARFYKEHSFIPPNHTYAIRGDVHREYPWLAFDLYQAFMRAKEEAARRLAEQIPSTLVFGREYLKQTRILLGEDPFPYGVEANREMLQTLVDYSHEQGLTKRKQAIEELFAPSTLGV